MSPSARQWSLLLAMMAAISSGVSQSWSEDVCDEKFYECKDLFQSNIDTCDHYNQTIHCLGTYKNHCIGNSLVVVFWRNTTIKNEYCPGNCYPVEGATLEECINSFFPPPPFDPPPPPVNCSYSPALDLPVSINEPPIHSLGLPSLSPPLSTDPECTLPAHNTFYRQHCSIFSLSHLRTFGDRNIPLKTCLLFGEFYLIKHQSLSIAVRGEFKIGNADQVYTDITEVNVTLHSHSCSPHSVSYTASVTADLPERVTGLSDELLTVENGTVVTILAPWINTSIVIHRTESHLSLTLQVPEPLTREGEVAGLCSEGCPAGYDVEPNVVEVPEYECGENKMSILVMCLTLGLTTPPVGTMLYSKLCSYDILLTHDLSLLSLYVALNQDALALSDETTPTTTVPTTSETPPTTPEPTSQMVSSVIIFSTTDAGLASQTTPTTLPLSPLVVILLSCLALQLR